MSIGNLLQILFWILIVSGTVFYFTRSVKRLFQVAGGLALFEAYNNLFDYGLWPIIQGWFGGYGALGLTLTALICNFAMLKWYRSCKTDWLGVTVTDDIVIRADEMLFRYRQSVGRKKLMLALPTLALWIAERGIRVRLISFLILSVFGDSFIATAFLLHRKNGRANVALKGEDYVVFILSTIFSCVVWTLFTEWITLPAFKNMWQTVFN